MSSIGPITSTFSSQWTTTLGESRRRPPAAVLTSPLALPLLPNLSRTPPHLATSNFIPFSLFVYQTPILSTVVCNFQTDVVFCKLNDGFIDIFVDKHEGGVDYFLFTISINFDLVVVFLLLLFTFNYYLFVYNLNFVFCQQTVKFCNVSLMI